MSDAIEAERKRAIAAIHWVFNADGTVGERAMAQEAIHKINDPTFMPAITAYEAAKGVGVGVKPLEWITDEFRSMECAASILGTYSVWEISGTGCYLRPDARAGVLVGTTIEDAKAAAQADHDTRVLSALTSPASGERDAWAGSSPFITSESGGGEYAVRIKVHSMDELHAAHTIVLKAFGAKL